MYSVMCMKKYDERYIKLGIRIAYLRKLQMLSQEGLAEKAGISAGYLAQIEAPGVVQPPSLNTLFAIADALDVSLSHLFTDC